MIFFKFYNSIATTYFCIGLIFISSSTSHALESEKTQTFRTNIDYGEVLKVIRNESAAGVFGRSLFKYPQHTPKSIHLIDIPKEGTGWIKIFERKNNSITKHARLYEIQKVKNWLKETEFSTRMLETLALLEPHIQKIQTEMNQTSKYCGLDTDQNSMPKDEKVETVVICTKERIDRDNSDLEEMQEFKEALASYKSTTNIQISQCNSEVLESELPNHCNTFLKTFYYWHYLTSDPEEDIFDIDWEKCFNEDNDTNFSEDPCMFKLLSLDYEDKYNGFTTPLSIQRRVIEPEHLSSAQKKIIEVKLTQILDKIREQLQLQLNSDNDGKVRILKPARVKIEGHNYEISANRDTGVLNMSETILRDIYLKAFHRAKVFTSVEFGEMLYEDLSETSNMLYEDLYVQPESVSSNTSNKPPENLSEYYYESANKEALSGMSSIGYGEIFSSNLTDFLDLMAALPGIKMPYLPASWLSNEMQQVEIMDEDYQWQRYIRRLNSQQKQDDKTTDALGLDEITYIFQVLAKHKPNEARDLRLASYINNVKYFTTKLENNDHFSDMFEKEMSIYSPIFAELMLLHQIISAELLKSYLFVLAHESWHFWFGGEPRTPTQYKQEELKADAHGMRVYLTTYKQINFEAFSKTAQTQMGELVGITIDSTNSAPSNNTDSAYKSFFETLSGRSPHIIMEETFHDTKFVNGSFTHPPLSERIAQMKEQEASGRREFTDQITKELSCAFDQLKTIISNTEENITTCEFQTNFNGTR